MQIADNSTAADNVRTTKFSKCKQNMVNQIICVVSLVVVASYLVKPSGAVMSDDNKDEILRAHNFYRSRVSPTPTDMVALVS